MMTDTQYVYVECDACGWTYRPTRYLYALISHVDTSPNWLCRQTRIVLRSGNFYATRYTTPNEKRFSLDEAMEIDLTKTSGVIWRARKVSDE